MKNEENKGGEGANPPTPLPPQEEKKPTEPEILAEKPKEEQEEKDIDYEEELKALKVKTPPKPTSKYTELEKAKFNLKKIQERVKELGGETEEPIGDDKFEAFTSGFIRSQAEAEIRKNSKSEAEVQYKMHFYDHRISKTENVFEDVDNALWLANKNRTRNALSELKRTPPSPGAGGGPGQRTPEKVVYDLPKEEELNLLRSGYKKVAPGRYEGTKMIYRFDEKIKGYILEKK